jgi:DNA-binding transcriptional regulator YhcF (GntR family)
MYCYNQQMIDAAPGESGGILQLDIDPASPTPPFEQLRRLLFEQIESGRLAAGTRLPTVRALALQLGLAANTVARCYRELEQAGVVETRGRNGTVVSWTRDAAEAELQRAAAALADRADALGVSPVRVREIVAAALGG